MESRCSVTSAVLRGVEAIPVTVEVSIGSGMPGMRIVGMGDTAVKEAEERVKGAIKACGFSIPGQKIVVNLAPGSLRKSGSAFDLAIAIGILTASAQIKKEIIERKLFVGELSLSGFVRKTIGTLAFGICAQKLGMALVSSGEDVVPIMELRQFSLKNLAALRKSEPFENIDYIPKTECTRTREMLDFADIEGHETAKRAAQIAVAGNHGLLMIGPPGSGKTMLASRISTICPSLTQEEIIEAAVIHSVAGEDISPILNGNRPFRHPHHSATLPGLVGGGNPIRPGEISLAHCGTLFLDELPEFKPSALQGLRQPMESGRVSITRADGNMEFPARFMLVAAANPCPCGFLGDDEKPCVCTIPQIRHYQGRIGGPLIDRIAIQLDVRRIPPESIVEGTKGKSSAELKDGVMKAIEYASWRNNRFSGTDTPVNSIQYTKKPSDVIEACALNKPEKDFLISAAKLYCMSGRSIVNCLKVARTIADMDECENVGQEHLAEAVGFRVRSS